LFLILLCPFSWAADGDYRQVTGPCALRFPEDHADHPDFRTEWWYYTGHLKTDDGAHFGFQLTFFRYRIAPPAEEETWPVTSSAWRSDQVYLAHAAITDVASGRHLYAEQSARAALDLAGVSLSGDTVTIAVNAWRPAATNLPLNLNWRRSNRPSPMASTVTAAKGMSRHRPVATIRSPVWWPGGIWRSAGVI
jgi:predicted secreted hydrolase